MNIFDAEGNSYTVPYVSIIYKGQTIPKDSIGIVTSVYIGDVTQIGTSWITSDGKAFDICFGDDFVDLIEKHIFVDVSTLKKPKTKPLFKEGDLAKSTCGDCVILDSKYDYSEQKWLYEIGEYYDYKRIHGNDFRRYEDELTKVNETKFIIDDNGDKELIIRNINKNKKEDD